MDDATRIDMASLTSGIAGALTEDECRADETHRRHPNAVFAIIRARRAGDRDSCLPDSVRDAWAGTGRAISGPPGLTEDLHLPDEDQP